MAECPKCAQRILHVTIEEVEVSAPSGKPWRGITYACPHCRVLLSVGIDPILLKADTVSATLAGLIDYLEREKKER